MGDTGERAPERGFPERLVLIRREARRAQLLLLGDPFLYVLRFPFSSYS